MLGITSCYPARHSAGEVEDDGGESSRSIGTGRGPVDEASWARANGPVAAGRWQCCGCSGRRCRRSAELPGHCTRSARVAVRADLPGALLHTGRPVGHEPADRPPRQCLSCHLVEEFEQHLDEKQYQEAYELAKSDESFLGQVLSAGLPKLSVRLPAGDRGHAGGGRRREHEARARLSYMALIGTISPMVGLFGTVQGMIASFRVIADANRYSAAVGVGQGYFHGAVHDAGRPGDRHSGDRRLQHPEEPHCPAGAGSGHRQRRSDGRFEKRGAPQEIDRSSCRQTGSPCVFERESGSGILEGDLTPMIDMTFQLIAFFMVLINFSQTEADQRILLPESELAKPPDRPLEYPITIQLKEDGTRDLRWPGAGEHEPTAPLSGQ